MPTRAQAVEILVASRARTEAVIADISETHMKNPTLLGGGAWSVKDLLGHLAGYEEHAAAIAAGISPPKWTQQFDSVDERNAADIERKRKWSMKRVGAISEPS